MSITVPVRKRLSPQESRAQALSAARDLLREEGVQAITLKSVAARILATATEFMTLRASPLKRKLAMALLNIGTAIALTTAIRPTTMIISRSETPRSECGESVTTFRCDRSKWSAARFADG